MDNLNVIASSRKSALFSSDEPTGSFCERQVLHNHYTWLHTSVSMFKDNIVLLCPCHTLTMQYFYCRLFFFLQEDDGIYTQRQKLSNTTFFGDTVLDVADQNIWVMEIKYFELYCKFYYFYEHFKLKMILWTKYLDNSRPCTKQVKMIQ